ncbi:MAG TPA: aminoglycoside adenylyltransferase domain-containing protein [Anaerolineales bacterium]|nr:aminoglycoside adenylyltransferase domain-containing protein [Anaerolineales bacterium]
MKASRPPHHTDQEIKPLLDELVAGTAGILADNFIGAWLQGSSATGNFDEHSDIDFAIGIQNDLSDNELSALQNFHPRLYSFASPWAKHLEGSYFPREILRDYNLSGTAIWYLNHGKTKLERSAHDNTIVVKWILREKGVVLAGPEPSMLIDPIPTEELRLDTYRTYAKWGKVIVKNPDEINSHFYQTFAVLGYCRMLHDLTEGQIGSKRTGAEWVKSNWGDEWHDLIDRAWAGRPNPALSVTRPADPDDLRRTVLFIQEVLAEARNALASFGLEPDSDSNAA